MPDPATDDRMSEADYARAYEEARRDLFRDTQPSEHPRAIVLAGQPGAGKGDLTKQATEELSEHGGAVVIDPDKLREYHQRDGRNDYHEMGRADYHEAATRVHPDASRMARELREEAIRERRNVIIDGTLNDPDKAEKLCRDLKPSEPGKPDYDVEIRALAVHERVSERGVAKRLEKGLANPDATPRDVPRNIQREAYEGMPESVARIEHTGVADRVGVYRRGSKDAFYTSSAGQQPVEGADAKAAILAERGREMTPAEKVEHAREWDEIHDMGKARQAPADELERYSTAHADAHVQLRNDPAAADKYDQTATPEQRSYSRGCAWSAKAPEADKHTPERAPSEKGPPTIEHE